MPAGSSTAPASATSWLVARPAPMRSRDRTNSSIGSKPAASPSMATAEPPDAPAPPDAVQGGGSERQRVPHARAMSTAAGGPVHDSRRWAWPVLGVILLGALGLRLWGIEQGLPYVYNIDEAGHFVPKAVEMSAHGLNPRYFVNPPALTYVLHMVLVVWLGGGHSVIREYALHPDRVFLVARVTVALLGTVAVWLLYLLGARLFN